MKDHKCADRFRQCLSKHVLCGVPSTDCMKVYEKQATAGFGLST